ncbi:Fc.00g059670.m01.CDS01 [Cosmosporella sp. VM-42]
MCTKPEGHTTDVPRASAPQPTPAGPVQSMVAPLAEVAISSSRQATTPSLPARTTDTPSPPPPAPILVTSWTATERLKSLRLHKYPKPFSYNPKNRNQDHAAVIDRAKKLEVAYKEQGAFSQTLVTTNNPCEEILRSQRLLGRPPPNNAHETKTFVWVTGVDGKAQCEEIDLEHLAKYEAKGGRE